MRDHVADGVLRRYLDEPSAVSSMDRDHLAGCARCGSELGRAAADRDLVAGALTAPAGSDPHLDTAWAALTARLAGPGTPDRAHVPSRSHVRGWSTAPGRRARLLRHPVAAGVAAGLVLLGGTAAAAAADWLPIFHTEKVSAVTLSGKDLQSLANLADLSALGGYGEVSTRTRPELVEVPDAAAAAARTGLAVPQVGALPTGVTGTPQLRVIDRQVATFTFSAAKATATARAAGATLPPMPAGLDGSQLQVEGGPAIAELWTRGNGTPTLAVVRMKAPTAASQGAPLPVVRDYLLALPGIPAGVAAQLKAVTSDGTTLPVPVPSEFATSSTAQVGGARATVLESKDGAISAVVWVADGRIQVVAGLLTRDDVLAVAHDLH